MRAKHIAISMLRSLGSPGGISHIVAHDGAYDVEVRTGMDFLVGMLHNAKQVCPLLREDLDLARQRLLQVLEHVAGLLRERVLVEESAARLHRL